MTDERGSIHPTSVVSPDAQLGSGVTVGPFCTINANVSVGEGSFVDSHTTLGAPTTDFYTDPGTFDPPPCRIGGGVLVRSHSVVYAGATIGDEVETGHRVTIREGSVIAEGARIGTLCDLQGELTIGRYARLHSSVFVPQGSTIEEFAWLFPHVVLMNDPHPPSDTCTVGPTVRRFAVIGAGAMVFPGVEIGEGAVVGAMTLVRKDVPPRTVLVGVPGHEHGAAADIECHEGRLAHVYPWWAHFRRGYPEGVLPAADETWPE
jgi:acetyltransferase-like isoleucine patch superfamily enzyme